MVYDTLQVEVKRVLEMAKHKKRNERVVRLVDAAARGSLEEVCYSSTSKRPAAETADA